MKLEGNRRESQVGAATAPGGGEGRGGPTGSKGERFFFSFLVSFFGSLFVRSVDDKIAKIAKIDKKSHGV